MALADSSIETILNNLEYSKDELGRCNGNIENYSNLLSNDANYQTFITNTEIGAELNGKLNTLVDIVGSVAEQLSSLIVTTEDFANAQKQLNKLAGTSSGSNATYSSPSIPNSPPPTPKPVFIKPLTTGNGPYIGGGN